MILFRNSFMNTCFDIFFCEFSFVLTSVPCLYIITRHCLGCSWYHLTPSCFIDNCRWSWEWDIFNSFICEIFLMIAFNEMFLFKRLKVSFSPQINFSTGTAREGPPLQSLNRQSQKRKQWNKKWICNRRKRKISLNGIDILISSFLDHES